MIRDRTRRAGTLIVSAAVLAGAFLQPGSVGRAAAANARTPASSESMPAAPTASGVIVHASPHAGSIQLARSKVFDLRRLPSTPPKKRERPEREEPTANPVPYPGTSSGSSGGTSGTGGTGALAPAPGTIANFDGLDFATWGAGHPPDPNGDVGPTYYIQTVNTSIGIYDKSSGTQVAAFTFDTFMSQGNFGNLCDTNNFGDPVVLYDTFENRWFITDFAFKLDSQGNVVNPPGSFQCLAVSRTGDPVSGGWNFYSINTTGGLGDYPKFGIWPDGIYMSTNMFGYAAGFQNVRVYAFNKAQMYAAAPSVQYVSFDAPSSEFTLLPSNARLQAGTPPTGSPNYFTSVWNYLNVVGVWKFAVNWNSLSSSTFTGPFNTTTPTWWAQYSGSSGTAPTPQNALDTLYPRLMAQNQYSNIGGVESLWDSHTVGAGNPTTNVTSSQAAVRYYQVKVTGGSVEANASQSFTFSPDALLYRYMPSVAVDRVGDMAIGYTSSNASTNPAIKYAGRLAGDSVNSITQSEQTLIQGSGSQKGTCGTSTCLRWGDYTAMTLDPDGCTFWYTNEYYNSNDLNDLTRIGSFKFSSCTALGNGGTIAGTVTTSPGGTPISNATVALGSRSTTTDGSGAYSFTGLPAGSYPSLTVTAAGFVSGSATSIIVTDGATTTRNFALTAAPQVGSMVDTTQADFQAGAAANTDTAASPGDVVLARPSVLDQSNTSLSTTGNALNTTTWWGETFQAGMTGVLQKADVNLFCSSCTGTAPNLTLSIRATNSGLPTGGDLASTTLTGNASGAASYFSGTFGSAVTLIAGTTYALIVRPVANPSAGTYAATASSSNVYAGGQRVVSTNSGSAWGTPTGSSKDLGFHVYVKSGYVASGTFESSLKDANPALGAYPTWGALSWTASKPAGTGLAFQAAASNSPSGPFSYVGPDGTGATSYTTSGGSLSQFDGNRYLRYRATLTTSNSASTPTINDVTVGFTDVAPASTSLDVDPATGTYGGTTTLSATLTSSAAGVSGRSIAFALNGTNVGSATTGVDGVASLPNVSLAGIDAGTYATGVTATFAGDVDYGSSAASDSLTIGKATATLTIDSSTLNPTYDGQPHSVGVTTSPSGLAGVSVTYDDGVNPPTTTAPTNAGTYGVTASLDNTNYAATDATGTLSIAKAPQTITIVDQAPSSAPNGDTFSVSATSDSGLTVEYGSSGGCTNSGADYTMAASGSTDCTVTFDQSGDDNHLPADQVTETVIVGPRSQSITFAALADKTYGDADFTVSATASSTLSVSFSAGGGDQCTVTGDLVHITAYGSCTITASQGGTTYWAAATPVSRTFSIGRAATTTSAVTITPIAPNPIPQFGDSVSLSATVTAASTAAGDGTFSGSVTFRVNGKPISGVSASVSNSSPTAEVSLLLDDAIIPNGAGTYAVTATFSADTSSNYAGSAAAAQTFSVSREGQASYGGRDGSTRIDYTGDQSVSAGTSANLAANVIQSFAPEASDTEYVDFGNVEVDAVFRIFASACGKTCPTAPVWSSSVPVRVADASTFASTGTGSVGDVGPATLAAGSYIVTVSLVANNFVLAPVATSTLVVLPATGTFVGGGGFVSADSAAGPAAADTGAPHGNFSFNVTKVKTTLSGSASYVYRLRINTATSTASSLVACTTLSATCRDLDVEIRTTKIGSLTYTTTTSYPRTASITGQNLVQYVDADSGTIYTALGVAAGAFRIDIGDAGTGGTTDSLGLSAYQTSGRTIVLVHQATAGGIVQTSTKVATNQATIGGGNLSVHPV